MENPKSNVEISNVHSQIVGFCSSLSLPSEPPDVRNWFPSYAYESPVVGASENFADSSPQERECEKDKEKLGISETNCNGEYTNQVSGSSHSQSLPSEPPDVGEWFSSYVYESPMLDTGLQDSHFKERECEDDGFVEESIIETEEDMGKLRRNKRRYEHTDIEKINSTRIVQRDDSIHSNKLEDQTLSKMVDSSVSFSLFSEPPDVGNWFSSYVYESPLLDSDFQDSHFSQRGCVKDKIIAEKNIREEDSSRKLRPDKTDLNENIVSKKVNSNELVKCMGAFENSKLGNQSLSKDDDKVKESKNMSLHIEMSCKGGPILQTRCASPAKGMEESSVKEEDFLKKLDQFSKEDDRISGKNNIGASSKGLTQMKNTKRKSSQDFNLIEPETHIDSIQGYIASTPKPFLAGTHKENGFVSIRKKRCTKENVDNSLKMSHEVSLEPCLKRQSLSIGVGDQKEGVVERKVLGDKSNMQNSISTVAGRWRCPQKSKPNLGPPMKQLRLEQWLHRI